MSHLPHDIKQQITSPEVQNSLRPRQLNAFVKRFVFLNEASGKTLDPRQCNEELGDMKNILLTSAEKTKVNSQHGHNTGKELLFDVSTALWHAATPLRCVAGEDNKHSSVRPA